MKFDLPESKSGASCWSFNKVQRTGKSGGQLQLWQSQGTGNPSFSTPLFFLPLGQTDAMMDIYAQTGHQFEVHIYLEKSDGSLVSAGNSFTVIGNNTTSPYSFVINNALTGVYRVHFEFIDIANSSNIDYVDNLSIDAIMFGDLCSGDVNYVETGNYFPGMAANFPVGETMVIYTATCNECIPVVSETCAFPIYVNGVTANITNNTNATCSQNNGVISVNASSGASVIPVTSYQYSLNGGLSWSSLFYTDAANPKSAQVTITNLLPGNHVIDIKGNFTTGECKLLSPLVATTGNTTDTEPPAIQCPAAITVSTNGGCTYIGTIGQATASDNCSSIENIIISNNAPAAFPPGTTAVTWTAKDAANNMATCIQNVTVIDREIPHLSNVPKDITVSCDKIPAIGTPSASDNCDAAPIVHYLGEVSTKGTNPVLPDYYNYNITRTWDAIDASGNHSMTEKQVITVVDFIPPELPVLPDINVGECSGTPILPTTMDYCSGVITGKTSTVFPITTQGTTVITWTFDDGNGNETTAQQNVIVDDISAPIPDIASLPVINGECSATATAPSATDNCKGKIVATTTDPLTYNVQGTYTIHWSFDDGNGNISNQTQTVIVDDVTPPVTPVLADVTVGECSGTPAAPTTTDNCTGTITGTTSTVFPITVQGTTVVTWTFDDGNGNITSAKQNVIVDDITAPVADVADLPVITGECNAEVTAPTATDNCVGKVTATTSDPLTYDVQGTYTIHWSFDDGNGNTSTQTQTVVVDDITAPVTPVLADVTVGECSGTPVAPTTTDNCTGTITGTTSTIFPITAQGTTVVTWTFDDDNGNVTTVNQNVIVDDVTPPVADIKYLSDATGECSVTVTAPTATDNCIGTITATTTDPLSYNVQGTYTIHWSYDDGNGNISTQTQSVVVDDISAPIADIASLPVINGECSAIVTAPTALDNCKGKIVGATTDPLTYNVQGIYSIHWIYDDGKGNISTQTQTVIVDDVTPPVTPVLADVTVGECSGTPAAPTTTDNCTGTITGTTSTVFPITVQGTTVVTWTFDDGNGNITSAKQNVIVDDITAPVADVADLPVITGECNAEVTAPTATDNCVGKVTATTSDPLTYDVQGTYTIHWSFDDGNGNTSTQTQTVVVDDVTAPVADLASLPVINGECSAIVTAPTATDNCKGKITATTTDPLTYAIQGSYTIHWTFDDGNGNTSTQTQTVLVDDVTAPVTPVLADVTVGECLGTPVAPTTTDNCTGTVTGNTSTVFPITTQGTTVVTWTFDDGNGNVTTAQQNVIVDDVTPPAPDIANLPNVTGECSATVTAPIATDNCKGKITATTSDPLTYNVQGSYTIHWSFDDGNGNISTQTQTVIVDDITAPVTPVLADETVGECSGTPVAPTTTDNCTGVITGTTSTVFPITTQGTTVVTWTFDDGNDNVTTADQNVIVDDVTPPVPDIASLPVINGECSETITAPIATDNCKGKITATTTDPLSYSDQGTYTIHWSYDDGNGNISTQTQTVIVDDVTPPVADVLDLPNAIGECSVTVTAPTATDNCKGTITATTTDPLSYSDQGSYIIHWSYDDGNGNISTQTQTVVVDDVTPPVAPILADVTVGECSGTPLAPTTTDNCTGVITGTTSTIFSITTQGTTVVTWTFDDGNGNVTTAQQNVIVDDISAPVADVADLPVFTGECSATAIAPTATDNCEGKIVATTTDPLTYNVQGSYTIHWIYDDGNGNISTQTQTVIVDDITAPVTPVLADETVGECSGTPAAPTTTDNCTGTITGTTSTIFPITAQGTTIVTWTFDDGNGNTTSAKQNVIVDDVTPPVPDIASLPVINGECSATVIAPTANDNCKGKITGTTTDPLSYSVQGSYIIHWTFDDGNGNISTQTQTVVVDDVTPPVTPVLADVTVGECSGTPVAPTTTDNCTGVITGTTSTVFPITVQGTTVVTWTFDDGNGNVTTQTQTVIVDDVTPPAPDIANLPNVTGECSATAIAPTATDNCKGKIVGTTTDPLSYAVQGTYTIYWSFDDGNGNTSTQTQTVLVDDVTAPVADLASLPVINGECSAIVTAPTSTDNCKGKITATTTDPLSYAIQGSYTIYWTFDDGNGNISTQTQTVIVDDITPPIPDVTDLPDITAECSATVTTPTATDNCNGRIVGTTTDPLSYADQGTYTIHWIYDDGNGNISTQTQTVIVDDITPAVPDVASLPEIIGECSATATAPTATDNCIGTMTATTTDPLSYTVQGTYSIHWIYDDGNGNISTQTQSVVVDDVTPPVTPVLADVTVGECSGTPVAPTTTDNCTGTITGTTSTIFPITAQGTTVVTWTFDDGNGNVTSANQNVIVDDITAPVPDIASLPVINGECSATVIAPTATDNCIGTITATTNDPLSYDVQGSYIIHWSYDDGNGNISTQTQSVVVDDVTPPVTPVLADVTVGECSGTPVAPTTTDNCTGTITGTTSTVFPITAQGTTVVTWTFDDGNGNITTAKQNVILDDITAPVADIASLPVINGECSATATTPTATDNCKGKIIATTTDPLSYAVQGTFTIHWSYDDGNGNISTQTQSVVVDDITPPAPDIANLPNVTGECSVTVTAPTATDNCKGTITATTSDPLTYNVQGSYTIHWSFDDGNGNISTQTQTVVVDDVTPPVAPILADVTVGECSETPVAPTTTDNCSGVITGTTSTIFPITTQGTTVVTWTFDDGNGNVISVNQNIIVDDVTPAVPDIASLPVKNGECSATAIAPTATDNCKGTITATTTDPLSYTVQGTYTIHWTFDDGNGNISTQTQTVVVDDITPPVIPVLADVNVGECSGTPVAPTTTDNCTGTITGTTSTIFPITTQGTTVITWTFDDGNGNISTQTQTVVVDDITPPVTPVLAEITVGECSGTPVAPTTTDNCTGTITGTTSTIFPITVQGTTVVTWTFDDGNGNVTTANQNVIVDDISAPVADVLDLPNAIGECSATVTAPTATDNCKGKITATTSNPLSYSDQGTYTIHWSYDDGNGNISTQTQTVIVDDVTPAVPDIASLPEIIGECSATATAPTATDNCKGTMTATTTDPLSYTVQGTYTIHWIYDDGNGNISTQTQTVVVDDVTPPVTPVLADLTVGECSGTPVAPTTTDNCSGTITGTTSIVFPITAQGITVVTWTFDDGNGNVTTAQQNVIVDDISAPVADLASLPVINGECLAIITAPTATDNCVGKVKATTSDPLSYFVQGTYTIHWVYDDDNGNISTQTQSVVVDDVTPPVTPVLADVTVGECSGTPAAPTTTDNCTGTITGTTSTIFPITAQGTTVVTWTFDDGNGNITSAKQNVIVDDVTPPVPDIASLPVINGECSATATTPTATDNCKGKITATTTDPLTYNVQGTYAIHWIYDDGNGNISTKTQSVVVDDVTPPVTPVLADVNVGECSGTPVAPTTTDNCTGVITGTTSTVFPITTQGTTVVTWTFDDGNGNVTTANQNVIVDDITAPVADVADLLEITGECNAEVTAPTATDNCKGKITATTTDPLTYNVQGTYTIHWTFDDGNGNIATQTQTVVVDDVTPPVADVLDLPNAIGECSVTVTAPTATDNCEGKITATTTDPLTYNVQGTFIINWSYDDGNGNISTQTQTVVVDDVTPPVTPVLADVNVGECSGTLVAPTTTDNCSGVITGTTSTIFPITAQGTTVVTWTFDDGNGNVTTANQNIIVDDITAPVADVTDLPEITGECSATAIAPTATDNCKGKIVATTTDPLTYNVQGTYTIHWIYDDGNGNISTQTQSVVVDDVTPPVIPILADVTVGECSGTPVAPTTTDNCNGTITGTTTTGFPITAQGTTVVTWTFDDGNGNVTTAKQNVIVDDVTAPVTPVLADVFLGECSGTPPIPTTFDNCSGIVEGTTSILFPKTSQGKHTIIWTFDDGNGNVTTAYQNLILDDVTAPVADIADLPMIIGECSATVTVPTATDNCKGKITATTTDPLSYNVQGTFTINWSYDDGNGNISTQTQTVVVDDITPPVTPILADVTVGECSGTPAAPTTTDNCSGVITGTTSTIFPITTQGITIVTWTFNDGNGNVTTANQNVIVDDITAPVADVADLPEITGECSATAIAPTATDNCKGKITATTTDPLTYNVQGTYTIHWIYDDGNGNISTQTQSVVVDDVTPPVTPVLADVNVGECSGTPVAPTTTDNCTGVITGTTSTIFPITTQGITVITWTFDDGNGNVTTANQNVIVDDITPPEISGTITTTTIEGCSIEDLPSAVNTVGELEAMGLFINDNCTPDTLLTLTSKDVSDGEASVTVNRTYTIKDASNNSTDYIQTIIIADTQKPTIICPPDVNITADAGNCHVSSLFLGLPIAGDNCTVSSITNDAPSIFELGRTIITWTVVDKSGNTATCQQNVNVDGSPLAIDDKIELDENTRITGNVMTNDLGLCDKPVQMHILSKPQFGSITSANDGSFEYIPHDNYFGTDMFTYQICDKDGDCSSATVEITINSVNDLPLSASDTEYLQVDVTLNGNVSANDIISGDGGNVWTLMTSPSNGTLIFNQDGTYTYNPNSGFIGNDQFSYELCDVNGDCSRAQVTIIVEDVLIPNQILTPNGDNHNDTFIIKGIEYYPVNKVSIYNRWGNIVYKKNNYQNEWDGDSNESRVGSRSLPVGTYYYLIDYGYNRHKTGFVYLER